MKYKRFGENIVVRLTPGEEIVSSLCEVCRKENVYAGLIVAVSCVEEATFGVFIAKERRFIRHHVKENMEVTSLSGTVSRKDGDVSLHLHATFARENGTALGGHLDSAVVSATCEAHIRVYDGVIYRKYYPESDLTLIDFDE